MKPAQPATHKTLAAIILLMLGSSIQLFAQSSDPARPKLKDFGSSLNHKKSKDKSSSKQDSDEDLIKVNTDLVVNDVLVLDEKGIAVKNLSKDVFIVTENNEPQSIEVFDLGSDAKIPRSMVLIIDFSISQIPFIVNSLMSAKILVDNLNPNDRMAIVTDNIELLCDFTRDKDLLKKKLDSLKERVLIGNIGQSRQYSALTAAANELFDSEDIRRIIIFQTDGDQINLKTKKFNVDEMNNAVEKSRATIYSIFPGMKYVGLSERKKYTQAKAEMAAIDKRFATEKFDIFKRPGERSHEQVTLYYESTSKQQEFLTQVAASTGGWTEYLETPAQANQVYAKILDGINSRYVIGYYPKNESKDGKRRTINIEVRNYPEYQVEGRKTYFPPEK